MGKISSYSPMTALQGAELILGDQSGATGTTTPTAVAAYMAGLTTTPVLASYARTAAEIAAGVTPTNYAYAPGDVRRYGADPTGATDSTTAIQNAVNSNTYVFFGNGGSYTISLQALSDPEGGTGIGINMLSNVTLDLMGATITLSNGATGSGAIIGNTAAVTNCVVRNGTVNANSGNTTGDLNAVLLENATDSVISGVTVLNARWIGIGFRNPGSPTTNYGRNVIKECYVNGSLYIGIQCNRPMLGLAVLDNVVENTTNNAIDIEGNNTAGNPGYGARTLVRGNRCYTCLSGIFFESVGEAIIIENIVQSFTTSGIYCNETNSAAESILIQSNRLLDGSGATGIYMDNNCGKILIEGNYFRNLTNSIEANTGINHIAIGVNLHENISGVLIHIPQVTGSLDFSRIETQDCIGARTAGVPFTCSPLGNSTNYGTGTGTSRSTLVTCAGAFFMDSGVVQNATSDSDYLNGLTGTLAQNSAWSNAYATYSGGDTIVYTTTDPGVGQYVSIGGYLYYVYATPGTDEYTLRLVTSGNNQGTAGNYTASPYNLNSAATWTGYYPQWQTT